LATLQPQVEVALIDGNEYFVKVFCEHRAGGFVKLLESLNTIGMDVVHATVTSHKGLVSNVFEVEVTIIWFLVLCSLILYKHIEQKNEMISVFLNVEQKKDSESVEAEDVRESLLELTRNRYRGWSHEVTANSENGVGRDQHQIAAYPHHFHT